jgi:triphosphatase
MLTVCIVDRPNESSLADSAETRRSSLRLVTSDETEDVKPPTKPNCAAAVKASPLSLLDDASFDTAIALTLSACLDHFVANWRTLNSPSESEGVHQMRVALRRLRAGVGILRRGVRSTELESAASRAKTIAAALGEARDFDVFSHNLESGPFAALRGEPSFYALLDAIEFRRREAHDRVRTLISSAQTRRFVRDLRVALTRRAWTSKSMGMGATQTPFASDAAGSALSFAARALDQLHRRAKKKCRGLAARSERERHEARIALKKIRYGAEFFQSLFHEEESARTYIRGVTKMQEGLGLDNDMTTAARLLKEIDAANQSKAAYAAGFVRGWHASAQKFASARCGRIEKALKKLKPFWR